MGTLREDLAAGGSVELVETHASWVFLRKDDVLKVKRPVDLGFLDFSTAEKRRAACEAEVALNRRLAPPGVYRGVVPIVRDAQGRHRPLFEGEPGDGDVVEHAVWMRRLDDGRRADRLLAAGRLGEAALEAIAVRLARFHAAAATGPDIAVFGRREAIERNVRENFAQVRGRVGRYVDAKVAAEVERWQLDFLARHEGLLAQRAGVGRVRDGHGDLRLEHVYLEQGEAGQVVTIVDCIEFNERFRYADVAADVAFLAMDLTRLGRADLAERFLALYAREADDFGLFALVDFYESYRAWVRGKVATFLAEDGDVAAPTRETAAAEARRAFLLALASERRSLLTPTLVAVGGSIASGKSTVATWISRATGGPVVDADRTRKHLLGFDPATPLHEPPFEGAYTAETSERVYGALLERAATILASGRTAIVDASFRARRHREAARELARRRGVRFLFVECRAAVEVCRRRLADRAGRGGVSDGRLEILDDFLASWEPADELGDEARLVVDTTAPEAAVRRRLHERLPCWPEGLRD